MSQGRFGDLEKSYDAISRRDVDGWLEHVHPDAELYELAEVPDARVYRGRAEIRGWIEAALDLIQGWQWTPEEVLEDDGETSVIRVHLAVRGNSGAPVEMVVFHVIETKDGKIVTMRAFLDQAEALEIAGLRE